MEIVEGNIEYMQQIKKKKSENLKKDVGEMKERLKTKDTSV